MVKPIILVLACGTALSVAYFVGVFVTSFDANLCYSSAIGDVASEAKQVLKTPDPAKVAAFEEFVSKLPLSGYETSCNDVAKAIEQYRKSENAK